MKTNKRDGVRPGRQEKLRGQPLKCENRGIKLLKNFLTIKEEKAIKDRNAAVEIISALINKGEGEVAAIRRVFDSMIPK